MKGRKVRRRRRETERERESYERVSSVVEAGGTTRGLTGGEAN